MKKFCQKAFLSKIALLGLLFLLAQPLSHPLASTMAQEEQNLLIVEAGDSIVIGIAGDQSNVLADAGVDIVQAVYLAIEEYNQAGGLTIGEGEEAVSFPIEAIAQDDRCTPDDAAAVAEFFVERGDVSAVVGHMCSGASIAASELYVEARIPMISPSSTAIAFTNRGLDVVNRTTFSDEFQGTVAARYMEAVMGLERIAIFHTGDPYGEGLAHTVRSTFIDGGGVVTAFQRIDPNSNNYQNVLESALSMAEMSNTQLIYFGGYTEQAAEIVAAIDDFGLEVAFFSADGVFGEAYLEAADNLAEGSYATFGTPPDIDEARNADFNARYEAMWGISPDALGIYHAEAYDATNIIFQALEQTAVLDTDGNLIIDREALILAIRATENYEGVSGVLTCDENGNCGGALIRVYQVQEGVWVELEVPAELQVTLDSD